MVAGVISLVVILIGALLAGRRASADALLVAVTVALVLMTLASRGHDATTHAFRIAALAEGLQAGDTAPLLGFGTIELPTFALYPTAAYLPPALLTLAGLPALAALNLTLAAIAVLTALGARAAFRAAGAADPARVAVLYVSASYIAANLVLRDALSETLSVALLTLVVLALAQGRQGALTLALAGAIAAHPVLAPLIAVATGAAWLALSRPIAILPLSVAGAAAVALAAPVWLPPVLLMESVAGPAALPVRFEDSFLPPLALLSPLAFATPGVVLLALAVLAARQARARAALAFGLALMALSLPAALPLHQVIAGIDTILFVWRWMAPACLLLALAVALGPRPPLAVVTLGAALSILPQLPALTHGGGNLLEPTRTTVERRLSRAGPGDWGMAEMRADLSRLPEACPAAPRTTMSALLAGPVDLPVRVPGGNPALFRTAGAGLARCGDDLVLTGDGPLRARPEIAWRAARLSGPLGLILCLLAIGAAARRPLASRPRAAS